MVKTIVAKGGRELWGRLEEESLLELIEPVCQSGLSAALTIRLGGETGHFYFDRGRMVHADTRSIRGKESAYEMISWRNGVFRLIRERKPEVETVDIDWTDFKQHYSEELQKIVLGRVSKVEGGFYLEIKNIKGESLFVFNLFKKPGDNLPHEQWFEGLELEQAIEQMLKGNIDKYSVIKYDDKKEPYVLIIRCLRELRYLVYAVFPEAPKVEQHARWLAQRFEPRALDAVSTALQRSDKTDVRGTILVIDDSPTVREMLSDILSKNGFRVYQAEDGYEGLIKVNDVRPDMIILDVLMPRIDGYEVCRRLKRDDRTRNIPIVMLSQKELGQDAGTGFREGADLYIEKPFNEKKITTIVENVLGLE